MIMHQTYRMYAESKRLFKNYPNPFITETWIPYELDAPAEDINLTIFNENDEPILSLKLKEQEAGYHEFSWDGRNKDGEEVASGMYIFLFSALIPRTSNFIQCFRSCGRMFLIR